ncbi:MAG: tetratricopeptide repeat protein [Rhizobiales bacterium]|nr:tetratricopeptide repeat protein [Hyphomicrobiales bacterium]
MGTRRLTFGPFELDAERKLLFKHGTPIAMGQRGLALLGALLAAGGRAVSKADLMDVAWPSQQVEESNLSVQIAALRKSLGQRPDGKEWIATVPRVGYQLIEEGAGANGRTGMRSENGKPSIAVLPFTNMSGDPEQEYFADGITADIITDLSKVSALSVIARQTTYGYKGKPVDIQEICRRLNVSSVVEGSVRKSGNRVRISAQLIDARDGTHLWADRYDHDLVDIFAVQDEITKAIVEQLKVKLLPKERAAIETIPTSSVEAYTYYLQGHHLFHLHTTSHVVLARRMFAKSLELDPAYARAYAGLANAAFFLYVNDSEGVTASDIFAASSKAIELDPTLAEAHASHGIALHHLDRYAEAVIEFERAVSIDPNCFEAYYFYAYAAREAGDLETSATMDKRASEIDPDDCRVYFNLAQVYDDLGRTEESLEMARRGAASRRRSACAHIIPRSRCLSPWVPARWPGSANGHALSSGARGRWRSLRMIRSPSTMSLAATRSWVNLTCRLIFWSDGARVPMKPGEHGFATIPTSAPIAKIRAFRNFSVDLHSRKNRLRLSAMRIAILPWRGPCSPRLPGRAAAETLRARPEAGGRSQSLRRRRDRTPPYWPSKGSYNPKSFERTARPKP